MNIFLYAWKNVALFLASVVAAYPMVRDNLIKLKQRQRRDSIIHAAQNVDPEIEKLVRQQLEQQGYACAQTVPLKVFESDDDTLSLCDVFDCCLGFSKYYEKKLKKILNKQKKSSLSNKKELELEHFIFSLDHEMFHIQNSHDKQSKVIRILIPCITEFASWPLLIQLATTSNPFFVIGLVVSVFCKRIINKCLEVLHARYIEKKAELWALDKNNNRESLKKYIKWQHSTILNLVCEHIECGQSTGSVIFPVIARLLNGSLFGFNARRYDTDEKYAEHYDAVVEAFLGKLYRQPYQWPLRLLCFEYDPRHPSGLDLAQRAQERLDKLRN